MEDSSHTTSFLSSRKLLNGLFRFYSIRPLYTPRRVKIFLGLTTLAVLGLYVARQRTVPRSEIPPPTYTELRKSEQALPQHDLNLPFPEGKDGRYVKFSNQIAMLGWNNVLSEVLMNAHLAYASRRAYVFRDYIWNPDHYPWPESQRLENPPRTPLSAIIAGTVVGQPFDEGDDAPRSVSESWFDHVCPKKERRIIYTGDVKPAVGWSEGIDIFNHWTKILFEATESCIEVMPSGDDNFPQIFDVWLWGSERLLSLWESFSRSPTSRLLRPSSIVDRSIKQNEHLFRSRSHPRDTSSPYTCMLAMHIRRGDFKSACTHFATWNSTFNGWNLLPQLPDRFEFPPSVVWNTTEYFDAHAKRCIPDVDLITAKAREARRDYAKSSFRGTRLEVVYLLTNEKGEWLEDLKTSLKDDGWKKIVTSHDLELDSEGIEVGMAIDMDIARRAAVFIGNGWSSFTSNVNHHRLVDGKDYFSIRFW
ncbi:hypothetical protein C0995_008413 [Termitomyces sp. Mi166|nr:hypothetical protein C0995_008413 [Termitomyces sp. Mi166\